MHKNSRPVLTAEAAAGGFSALRMPMQSVPNLFVDPAMTATWRAAEGGGPYMHTQTSRFYRRGRPAWRPGGPAATRQ